MKLWICEPAVNDTVLSPRLRLRWQKVAQQTGGLSFIKAEPGENHGMLLTRIWQEILNSDDPLQVISELDFIPYDTFNGEMKQILLQSPALFLEYVTREEDLQLRRHGPLSGAWLLGFNRDLASPDLPLDWLAAAGPFNDAANNAYSRFPENPDTVFEEGHDEAPASLGLEYSGLGYHCFFHRHFADPLETVLFPGYSLGAHLRDVTARLDALEV